MRLRLGIPTDQIPILRQVYFQTYGTTLLGLQYNFQIDPKDFLAFVHDLPIEEMLSPDSALCDMLNSLPQAKWIFTNADDKHATRVLRALGLEACFSGIIDINALDFICKPSPNAYRQAMQIAGVVDPARCVYLDDSPRNLLPAQGMGFFTVLVSQAGQEPAANLVIGRPHDLPNALPGLWDSPTLQ